MFLFNKHAFHIMVEVRAVQYEAPPPELGMNSPPQSQTALLFISLLFGRRLVYSARSTFLCSFSFCLVLLHGWISFVLPAETVHGGKWPKCSECSPLLLNE